jgi:hypothetical protein
MRIAIIGRTELLYNIIEQLLAKGHTISCVLTAKEAPEYTKSAEDFKIAKNGFATYEIPEGGSTKVVKSGDNYIVETVLKRLDENGVLQDYPIPQEIMDSKTFSVPDYKEKFYRDALALAKSNNIKRAMIAKAKGIKDPTILNK